jgi:hypothetical protein
VIVVLGDEQDDDDPGHALGQGLRDLGEDVLTLSSAPTSGDVMADSLGRLEARGAPIGAVVLASVGAAATQRGDLAGIGPDQWRDRGCRCGGRWPVSRAPIDDCASGVEASS